MGMPTFFDLPATTTFFPSVGMPAEDKMESEDKARAGAMPESSQILQQQLLTSSLNDLPHPPWGSRQHGVLVKAHAPHIYHVKAINVFVWSHSIANLALIDMFWKRTKSFNPRDQPKTCSLWSARACCTGPFRGWKLEATQDFQQAQG